jgi:beta-fructofuranosidase
MPQDSFRPQFHFTAPANYLNDPNGLIQVDGVYHLFYQYHTEVCPKEWWVKHWGHATSRDLVTWTDQPIALFPGKRSSDVLGCWSGCAIADGEEIRIYYTGLDADFHQTLCLARGDKNLLQLAPEAERLFVAGVKSIPWRTFRDPYVWRVGNEWRALIAGADESEAIPDGILELSSADGISWRAERQRICLEAGTKWIVECPNRFVIDGREIILCSVQPLWTAMYVVGEENQVHSAKSLRLLSSDSRFYAPLVFRDEQSRLIMMGYIEEARSEAAIAADGWCNLQSLPMELTLVGDQLHCRPIEALKKLRRGTLGPVTEIEVEEKPRILEGIAGNQCEIECAVECGASGKLYLDVLTAPGGEEFTRVELDGVTGGIHIDNAYSSLDPATANQGGNDRQGPRKMDWKHMPASRRLTLRIFIDHSVVEVFTSAGAFTIQRAYPTRSDSRQVRISAQGAGFKLIHAQGWELEASIAGRG